MGERFHRDMQATQTGTISDLQRSWPPIQESRSWAMGTCIRGKMLKRKLVHSRWMVCSSGAPAMAIRMSFAGTANLNRLNVTGQRKTHHFQILDIAIEHARLYREEFLAFARLPFPPHAQASGLVCQTPAQRQLSAPSLTQTSDAGEVEAVIDEYLDHRRGWGR